MNKMRVLNVRGQFLNIYAWGEGWTADKHDKWNEYLENYKGTFWRPVMVKNIWRLVSTGGCIYLHPMDFNAILNVPAGKSYRGHDDELEDRCGDELDELYRLCKGLAEACGGQFGGLTAGIEELDFNDLRVWEIKGE